MDMEFKLISAAQSGDTAAFQQLMEKYKLPIYRLCYGFVREPEEAQDLAQETFISAFHKLNQYQPTGSFRGWLSSIAYTRFLNQREKNRRRLEAKPQIEEEIEFLSSLNSDRDIEIANGYPELDCALQKLPEDYQVALELRYHQGMGISEIAETLEIPAATVKIRLYRAKHLLSKALCRKEKRLHEM